MTSRVVGGLRTVAVPVALLVLLVVPAVTAPPAGASPARARQADRPVTPDRLDPWIYRPPVDAPVADPFRPPPQPWESGNRGLEYASTPGSTVGAIGPGVVTFAGPVAGTLHVTVLHPDGLRSSYSFVAAVRVQVDQRVAAGEAVAVAGEGLHLGVRRGDTYLDPASLWGRRVGPGRVVLVPDHPDLRPGRDGVPGHGVDHPVPPRRSAPRSSGGAHLARAVTRAVGDLASSATSR